MKILVPQGAMDAFVRMQPKKQLYRRIPIATTLAGLIWTAGLGCRVEEKKIVYVQDETSAPLERANHANRTELPSLTDQSEQLTAFEFSRFFENDLASTTSLTDLQRSKIGQALAQHISPHVLHQANLCLATADRTRLACGVEKYWQRANIPELEELVTPIVDHEERLVAELRAYLNKVFQTEQIHGVIEALRDRLRRLDELLNNLTPGLSPELPILAASFFQDRTFLLTTAIDEVSASGLLSDTFNISALRVRMEVSGPRLLVYRLSRDSRPVDELVASFPIVQTIPSSGDVLYQVDFSRPENPSFLTILLERIHGDWAAEEEAKLRLDAQLLLPTLMHPNKRASSDGLRFTKDDNSLVLSNLLLVQSDGEYFPVGTNDGTVGKNPFRVTARLVMGFLPLGPKHASYSPMSIKDAQSHLTDGNKVKMPSGADKNAVPYFTADARQKVVAGRRSEINRNARRLDLSGPLTLVLDPATPPAAATAIAEAAGVWNRALASVVKESAGKTFVETVDAKTFQQRNPQFSGELTAADPRYSMVAWSANPSVAVAWASSLVDPVTGRIEGADILMSGVPWAKHGCFTWFERRWKTPEGSEELAPPGSLVQMWLSACDAILERLGFLPPDPSLEQIGSQLDQLVEASVSDNHALLNSLAAQGVRSRHGNATDPNKPDLKAYDSYLNGNGTAISWNPRDHLADSQHTDHGLDCVRTVLHSPGEGGGLGLPTLDYDVLDSPQKAAIATVKAVLVHELGHILGLRHNFRGSAGSGSNLELPVKTLTRTQSVMDYNDIAIDLDYGLPDDAGNKPEIGAWDWLALWALYGDTGTTITIDPPLEFCTDQNVTGLDGCQRHDFGTNYAHYLLYTVNQQIAQLRKQGLGTDAAFAKRLQGSLANLWFIWSSLASELGQRSAAKGDRQQKFDQLRLLTLGAEGLENTSLTLDPYLASFEEHYGFPVLGLVDLLTLTDDFFQNPDQPFRRWDRLILTRAVLAGMPPALDLARISLQGVAGRLNDLAYLPLIPNVKHLGQTLPLQDDLLRILSHHVLLPAGETVHMEKIGFGNDPGIEERLVYPFFNHSANVTIRHTDAGDRKNVYRLSGRLRIAEIQLALESVSRIAAGHRQAASVTTLQTLRKHLVCLLDAASGTGDGCGGTMPGSVLSADAVQPAFVVLEMLDRAIETAREPVVIGDGDNGAG